LEAPANPKMACNYSTHK